MLTRFLQWVGIGCLAVLLAAQAPAADDKERVILVDMRVSQPADATLAYTSRFDHARVNLELEYDDPLMLLEDYAWEEDPIESPGCFMPEFKMIFYRYTYVFSFYCTSVEKYVNTKPFVAGPKKIKSDIEVTESVLEILLATRKKYFGNYFDRTVANRFFKLEPLGHEDVDDSILFEDEDEDADEDLRDDAIDREGWFDDNVEDPSLQLDDSLDDDDKEDEG